MCVYVHTVHTMCICKYIYIQFHVCIIRGRVLKMMDAQSHHELPTTVSLNTSLAVRKVRERQGDPWGHRKTHGFSYRKIMENDLQMVSKLHIYIFVRRGIPNHFTMGEFSFSDPHRFRFWVIPTLVQYETLARIVVQQGMSRRILVCKLGGRD